MYTIYHFRNFVSQGALWVHFGMRSSSRVHKKNSICREKDIGIVFKEIFSATCNIVCTQNNVVKQTFIYWYESEENTLISDKVTAEELL